MSVVITTRSNTVSVTDSTVNVSSSDTINSVSASVTPITVAATSTVTEASFSPTTNTVEVNSGARALSDLSDVDLTGKIDKSLLIFDQAQGAFSTSSGTTTTNLGMNGGDF